ncbi:MAG: hypothetical protein WBH59_01600 [Atribacterales bacterium]
MLLKYLWTPDRNIQGQAKNGLKIAGVTKRWESKCFKYCGPLINILRGDGLGEKTHRGFPVLLFRFLIEPFRNDILFFVMPEGFYQESTFLLFSFCPSIGNHRRCPFPLFRFLIETFRNDPPPSFPKSSIGNPYALKNHGPRLKNCRGDEQKVIETFRGRLKTA